MSEELSEEQMREVLWKLVYEENEHNQAKTAKQLKVSPAYLWNVLNVKEERYKTISERLAANMGYMRRITYIKIPIST